jgi:hypothetical protein
MEFSPRPDMKQPGDCSTSLKATLDQQCYGRELQRFVT